MVGSLLMVILCRAPVVSQPLSNLRCCDGDAVTFECHLLLPKPTATSGNGGDNSTNVNVRWEKGGKVNFFFVYRACVNLCIKLSTAKKKFQKISFGDITELDEWLQATEYRILVLQLFQDMTLNRL